MKFKLHGMEINEGQAVHVDADGKDTVLRRVRWSELKRWAADKRRVHILGDGDRPGVVLFLNELEHRHYWPPGSTVNALFTLHMGVWQGRMWAMATVPARQVRFAHRVAAQIGLEALPRVPLLFQPSPELAIIASSGQFDGHPAATWFPLKFRNVYTLEFLPGHDLAQAVANGNSGLLRNAEKWCVDANTAREKTAPDRN
jgi:hypothetical protein